MNQHADRIEDELAAFDWLRTPWISVRHFSEDPDKKTDTETARAGINTRIRSK